MTSGSIENYCPTAGKSHNWKAELSQFSTCWIYHDDVLGFGIHSDYHWQQECDEVKLHDWAKVYFEVEILQVIVALVFIVAELCGWGHVSDVIAASDAGFEKMVTKSLARSVI